MNWSITEPYAVTRPLPEITVNRHPSVVHGARAEARERELLELAECQARIERVSELAARLGMTISKLSNYFPDVCGVRPSTYLKRDHVLHAITVIRNINLDYSTIAGLTGFRSRTQLFQSIRRVTGRTPDSFRAKRRRRQERSQRKS